MTAELTQPELPQMSVTDRTALSVIRPQTISQYLSVSRYRRHARVPTGWLWRRLGLKRPETREIFVPDRKTTDNYHPIVSRMLNTAAACENRTALEIYWDVAAMNSDSAVRPAAVSAETLREIRFVLLSVADRHIDACGECEEIDRQQSSTGREEQFAETTPDCSIAAHCSDLSERISQITRAPVRPGRTKLRRSK